jgi:hypothetical protein
VGKVNINLTVHNHFNVLNGNNSIAWLVLAALVLAAAVYVAAGSRWPGGSATVADPAEPEAVALAPAPAHAPAPAGPALAGARAGGAAPAAPEASRARARPADGGGYHYPVFYKVEAANGVAPGVK